MKTSLVIIQQRVKENTWRNIPITRIINPDEEIIVVGKAFRILVDGNIIYDSRGKQLSENTENYILEKEIEA